MKLLQVFLIFFKFCEQHFQLVHGLVFSPGNEEEGEQCSEYRGYGAYEEHSTDAQTADKHGERLANKVKLFTKWDAKTCNLGHLHLSKAQQSPAGLGECNTPTFVLLSEERGHEDVGDWPHRRIYHIRRN